MTIDRDRLDRAIRNTEATPRSIDWLGPGQVKVVYEPGSAKRTTADQTIAQASYQQSIAASNDSQSDGGPIVSEADARRIIHWIELAIDREQPQIAEAFRIQIDRHQVGLRNLQSIAGVTSVEPVDEAAEGVCRFRVFARSPDGPTESTIQIQLTALPRVVVPRTTLARGHRIGESDLTIQPISAEKLDTNQVTDPNQIVGLEVRATLRTGKPISIGDVGSPILVHRGDLVEVRVMSGGVTVTTNAKTLGDGAESDLVEIETMRPKKRLVARVVRTGLVEIVTRAPAVRYRETSR